MFLNMNQFLDSSFEHISGSEAFIHIKVFYRIQRIFWIRDTFLDQEHIVDPEHISGSGTYFWIRNTFPGSHFWIRNTFLDTTSFLDTKLLSGSRVPTSFRGCGELFSSSMEEERLTMNIPQTGHRISGNEAGEGYVGSGMRVHSTGFHLKKKDFSHPVIS
jgi:hypothetical protein